MKGRGVSDREKYPTMDEREPSDCARRTEDGKGLRRSKTGFFWAGMNDRDQTDEVTHRPVGEMLRYGFHLLSDDEHVSEREKT